jgi:hypothetical protein
MELRHLRYFVAVAETENVSRVSSDSTGRFDGKCLLLLRCLLARVYRHLRMLTHRTPPINRRFDKHRKKMMRKSVAFFETENFSTLSPETFLYGCA